MRGSRVVALLCDGPRGPARRLKPGAITVARLAGVPLRPVAFSARPAVRFGSWDRALLPLALARVVYRYGPPLEVPKSLDDAEREALRQRVEHELNEPTDTLDAQLGVELDAVAAHGGEEPV